MPPYKRLPILVGCKSRRLVERNEKSSTHEWVVYVKSFYDEDFTSIIRNVAFVLHPTFDNPKRSVADPPYRIKETGFGEFDMRITIHFKERTMKSFFILQPVKLNGAPQLSAEEQLDEDKWLHDKQLVQINIRNATPSLRTILSQYSEVDDGVRQKIRENINAQQCIKNEIKKLQMEAQQKLKSKKLTKNREKPKNLMENKEKLKEEEEKGNIDKIKEERENNGSPIMKERSIDGLVEGIKEEKEEEMIVEIKREIESKDSPMMKERTEDGLVDGIKKQKEEKIISEIKAEIKKELPMREEQTIDGLVDRIKEEEEEKMIGQIKEEIEKKESAMMD